MSNRRSGPDFRKQLVPLEACKTCQGKGVSRGLFYEMECDACNGAGLTGENGSPIDTQDLVVQLRLRLNLAKRQIKTLKEHIKGLQKPDEAFGSGPGRAIYRGD